MALLHLQVDMCVRKYIHTYIRIHAMYIYPYIDLYSMYACMYVCMHVRCTTTTAAAARPPASILPANHALLHSLLLRQVDSPLPPSLFCKMQANQSHAPKSPRRP